MITQVYHRRIRNSVGPCGICIEPKAFCSGKAIIQTGTILPLPGSNLTEIIISEGSCYKKWVDRNIV